MKLEDNVFSDLPLLLPVPHAAKLLGISRQSAYRLPASCRSAGSAVASTW
jgi:hypothetical protein